MSGNKKGSYYLPGLKIMYVLDGVSVRFKTGAGNPAPTTITEMGQRELVYTLDVAQVQWDVPPANKIKLAQNKYRNLNKDELLELLATLKVSAPKHYFTRKPFNHSCLGECTKFVELRMNNAYSLPRIRSSYQVHETLASYDSAVRSALNVRTAVNELLTLAKQPY